MIINVVTYSNYDGSCSYDRMVKAFLTGEEATEYAAKCKVECERIDEEVKEWNRINMPEITALGEIIRDTILDKKSKVDITKTYESIRRIEMIEEETNIFKTHKYDPDFSFLEDEYCYNVEELEFDNEEKI